MGITLFNFKTKEQREAKEAAAYQTALKNFNDFITQQQQILESEKDSTYSQENSNLREEDTHLLAPLQKNIPPKITPLDLEILRNDIIHITKKYDFLMPIMTRALNAVDAAMKQPSRETKRELFFAQLTVSRVGDASRGISTTLGLMSLSFIAISVALVIVIGIHSLFLPGFFLCLGILLAIAGGSRRIAISPKEEINDRDAVAATLSFIRKSL